MADLPTPPENTPNPPKPAIKISSADKKSDTTRIDLASAKPPPSITDKKDLPPDADDYFKRSTIRIDAPPGNADTAKLSPAETVKRQTTRIDVPTPSDDVFKSKTIPVGIPANPPPSTAGRPKTIQMKRPTAAPGESIIVSPDTTESATAQARKSETARIDLAAAEADRPATRPKTIRIKRPDGSSGRKPLTISRPEGSEDLTVAPSGSTETMGADEEDPGLLVGLAAIAALLVTGVLFYLLLAQTLAPTLPFPGRI
jgi:hypothetical protein